MESNTAVHNEQPIRSLVGPVLIILIFGALAGLAAAVVGSLFYIIAIFTIGMGVAGGAILGLALRSTNKIRRTGQMAVLAVLTATVIYGTFHYGRYLSLQLQSALLISSKAPEASLSQKLMLGRVIVDAGLKDETGHGGFLGYMLYKAQTGVSIGRFYSENRVELTSIFAWLYWAAEFGVILYITLQMGKSQLSIPVCEVCGQRFSREKHLGGTAPANESLLLDLLRQNNVTELGRLIEKEAGLPSVELYMRRCEACGQGSSYITVRRAALTAKGSVALSDISQATLPPGQGAVFISQLSYTLD